MEEIKDKNLTLFFFRSSLLAKPKKRFPKNSFFDFNKITAFSSNFKKSTQKEVVSEVSAESALEYAAAIIPSKNIIPPKVPR